MYEVGSTSGSIYVSISNSTLVFLSSTNIRIMSTVIFTYVIIGHAHKSPFIIVGRFSPADPQSTILDSKGDRGIADPISKAATCYLYFSYCYG